jgi:anthranilate synthase component 2
LGEAGVKVLFVDHRDSFSANLVAALRVAECDVDVVQYADLPSDEFALVLMAKNYDALVLSPGPGNPLEYERSAALYRAGFETKPVLGVCLGLQIVLSSQGFSIERVSENPVHGRQVCLKLVLPNSEYLWEGLFVFYNSLGCLASDAELLGRGWRVLARDGRCVAAAKHKTRPHVLAQFHPESFASLGGDYFIRDFVSATKGNVGF